MPGYVGRLVQVVVPRFAEPEEQVLRSGVDLVVVILLDHQTLGQGFFKDRRLFAEKLFADLPFVELRVDLVQLRLVFLSDLQVFLKTLAQLLALTQSGQLRVETFLRVLKLRRLVLLERSQLAGFFRRLFACCDFLFQCHVTFKLGAQQIFAGEQRLLVSGLNVLRLDVGDLLLKGGERFSLGAELIIRLGLDL
ncbi:hypothetical protein D3C76_1007780 [compost metagenome]